MKFETRIIVEQEVIGHYAAEPFSVDGILYNPPPRLINHSAMFTVEPDHLCDPNDTGRCWVDQ